MGDGGERASDNPPFPDNFLLQVEAGKTGAGEEVGGKKGGHGEEEKGKHSSFYYNDRVPAVCQAPPRLQQCDCGYGASCSLWSVSAGKTDARQIRKCRAQCPGMQSRVKQKEAGEQIASRARPL